MPCGPACCRHPDPSPLPRESGPWIVTTETTMRQHYTPEPPASTELVRGLLLSIVIGVCLGAALFVGLST